MSRRSALSSLGGLGLLALGGCSRTLDIGLSGDSPPPVAEPAHPPAPEQIQTASIPPDADSYGLPAPPEVMYGALTDNGFALPGIPAGELKPKHLRRLVVDPTGEAPGTIVVHLRERHLYLVQENGDALRYGVSIGKEGFSWSGRAVVDHVRKWPTWTPPSEMVARRPELEKYRGGQPGGPKNPLGARALYIYKDGVDTLYRVHGTPEWRSIGKAASSGCVRMINQDVIDLYERVKGRGKVPIVVVA
jgi:lipoprotein-anchoring transpeptidase ErfK/SrfK